MSDVTYFGSSGGSGTLPTDVAQEYVTDDGTVIPVANSMNVNGIDSVENNNNGILVRANPDLSENMEVVITNRVQGIGSTSGVATIDLITFNMGATAGVYKFSFDVAGFDSTNDVGVGYQINASARTDGEAVPAATIISIPDGDEDEDDLLDTADWNVVTSGNNLILQVTGVNNGGDLNINWGAVGSYVRVL